MPKSELLEPSFDDVLVALARAADLPAAKRSALACSVGQIAKALGRAPTELPARWTSARFAVGRLHAARLGANPKTLANHKSNVRAALLWFAGATGLPTRGAPLSPDWALLRDAIADRRSRAVLYPFMRYCSAKGIAANAINEAALDGYMRYRAEATALASDAAARRGLARRWNACRAEVEGWPDLPLSEPTVKTHAGPAWDEFPHGLHDDVEAHLKAMTKVRKKANGKRIRGCAPSTIRRCRAELVAAARKAVKIGVPIESLTSLSALVHPDVAERIIDAYWAADGEAPKVYTIDLGWKLLSIARRLGLPDTDLERLDQARADLEEYRPDDLMTDKNRAVIRHVTKTSIWREVVRLPGILMEEAHAIRHQSPVKAAVTAQIAVAIAILTFAPIRLANLARIRLDQNLIRPTVGQALLLFQRYDVKNHVDLEFPLDVGMVSLINDYIDNFRPTLLRGGKGGWLFPGEDLPSKDPRTLSGQISQRVQKALGFSITAHQFRHAAAAIWLTHHPGDYETVRRMLGHRNIQTTIRFYVGLETDQANAMFGGLVRELIEFAPEPEPAL